VQRSRTALRVAYMSQTLKESS